MTSLFERIGPDESRIRLDGDCVGPVYRQPDNFNLGAHFRPTPEAAYCKALKRLAKPMARTLHKNIRVTPEQWNRIENAAAERYISANRRMVELAMGPLDRREWPRTELESACCAHAYSRPKLSPVT